MNTKVFFVPLVDCGWQALGALNPRKNFATPPPPLEMCAMEAEQIVDLFYELFDGKMAISPYSGTYCRDAFTDEPFISTWQKAVKRGAEILVHPHEEIGPLAGTKNHEEPHMREVILRQYDRLIKAGIRPVGYRGGLYGMADFIIPIIEELGMGLDFSCAPGMNKVDRAAEWQDSPATAYRLCNNSKSNGNLACQKSDVIEIPIGADGMGSENTHYLYVDYEDATLESVKAIWDRVAANYEQDGKPQIIHTLLHEFSMSNPHIVERFKRFTQYMQANGGVAVAPGEARKRYIDLWESKNTGGEL